MSELRRWRRERARRAPWLPEYDTLARFNGERARGIVHSESFSAEMAALQKRYDEEYLPALRVELQGQRSGSLISFTRPPKGGAARRPVEINVGPWLRIFSFRLKDDSRHQRGLHITWGRRGRK